MRVKLSTVIHGAARGLTKARARGTVGNRMGRGRTERIGIF